MRFGGSEGILDCGMRNADCGLTRPAGLALRAACGCLPSAISTAFRLSRSARLRIGDFGSGFDRIDRISGLTGFFGASRGAVTGTFFWGRHEGC